MLTNVAPALTPRAEAFRLWMKAPNPMVTFFKTLNVSPLLRRSRKRGEKFNMLMLYCIGRAASRLEEFYLLPVGEGLFRYDGLAVGTIVQNRLGGITSCDIPFFDDLAAFRQAYDELTERASISCQNHDERERMVIGTSAITVVELDGAVGMYSGIFNNPFLIWGRYRRGFLKTHLPVSFQFHHTQMDGAHAGVFLARLQQEIDCLR